MVDAEWPADHSALAKGIEQHIPEALADFVKTVIRLAQSDKAKTPVTAPGKKGHCRQKNDRVQRYIRRHS
jgi:hypothetical protein